MEEKSLLTKHLEARALRLAFPSINQQAAHSVAALLHPWKMPTFEEYRARASRMRAADIGCITIPATDKPKENA